MARGPKDGNRKGQEYKLSIREEKFVTLYLEYGDPTKAVVEAKFRTNSPKLYAKKLLSKPKIQKEVAKQMELFKNEAIASSQEIMRFYTMAMRGEVKDQFGIEATLADRMKAADALAKRQIDAMALVEKAKENTVTINLCWDRSNSVLDPNIPVVDEPNVIKEVNSADEDDDLDDDEDIDEEESNGKQ